MNRDKSDTAHELRGRVLIVDDQLANRLYMQKVLTKRGCDVISASSGEEACRLAKEKVPDLMLVDIIMPGMDGYEVCQRVRAEPITRDIPVILVTAKSNVEDLERGFDVGASDYIKKPFDPRELVVRVRTSLDLKHARDELLRWQKDMSHQLQLAGALQHTLLDLRPILTERVEVRKAYRPCLLVGGDVFDIVSLPNDKYCLYMADVCGHGVAPAMITSLIKAVMAELLAFFVNASPSVICNAMHLRFRQHIADPSIYATFFIAFYTPSTQEIVSMCCGHPPPLMLHPQKEMDSDIFLKGGGLPIGLSFSALPPYAVEDEVTFTAELGMFFFLYTDGLMEAVHKKTGHQCGIELLKQIASEAMINNETVDFADAVFERLLERGYDLNLDDCSAVAIHVIDPDTICYNNVITAQHEEVNCLASEVEGIALERGWSEETAAGLQLLLMEHGANIVNHGQVPSDSPIHIQIRFIGDTCRILLRDYGHEWDFGGYFAPSKWLDENHDHGRGMMIIKQLTSNLDVYRKDNVNVTHYVIQRYLQLHSRA